MRYHRYFGRKTLYVFRFAFKVAFGNEHREVRVLNAESFESFVHFRLNVFPNGVTVGADNHRAFNGTVIYEFRFYNDVCIPLRKIFVNVRYILYELFVFSHNIPLEFYN